MNILHTFQLNNRWLMPRKMPIVKHKLDEKFYFIKYRLFITHSNVFYLWLLSSKSNFDDWNTNNAKHILNTLEIFGYDHTISMKELSFSYCCNTPVSLILQQWVEHPLLDHPPMISPKEQHISSRTLPSSIRPTQKKNSFFLLS